jgi:competence protein ComFC
MMTLTATPGPQPVHQIYQSLWKALDWIYPPDCSGCGIKGVRWCSDCQSNVHLIGETNICSFCGKPMSQSGICSQCQDNPPSYHAVRSCSVYQGSVRNAILKLKFKNDIGIGDTLSNYLIDKFPLLNWQIDLVIPVPLTPKRKQNRGYNQSTLLGWPLALVFRLPFKPAALKRQRETKPQVGLNAHDRFTNIENAFVAAPQMVKNKNVLVIDDVTTTGATMGACADALLKAGAACVYGLTLAKAGIMDDTLTAQN